MDEKATGIVIDCPKCKRTIWAGATCYHGFTPLTPEEEKPLRDREVDAYKTDLDGGLKRARRTGGK